MKLLRELLHGLDCDTIIGNTNSFISNIQFDSNKVSRLDLFVAINGQNHDGHDFIEDVISAGVTAIVCERIPEKQIENVTYIKVSNSSMALGILASNFFNNPSKKINLIGITGTNGKTSTAYYLFSLFKKLNFKVGLISTIDQKINNKSYPATHTTPNPIELNRLLSLMVKEGCDFCFMEVSSHAISQNRIAGLYFDIAVFTNITRDHLDYHKSFRDYINTKKSFFDSPSNVVKSIVNIDDKYGYEMLKDTSSKKIFYSLTNNAHYQAVVVENSITGLTIRIDNQEITTQLIGDFNAYNLLAVYSIARELGQNQDLILKELSNIKSPPGRFNIIRSRSGVIGIVDYAHTPDALKKAILSISDFCDIHKNLIIVLGCGGNRDRGKRRIMGKIAAQNSLISIFTSDNPRLENPDSIIDDMCEDLSNELKSKVHKIINREDAIDAAVRFSSNKSIILIAGKGHEQFQEINGKKIPFDDFKTLKKLLKT